MHAWDKEKTCLEMCTRMPVGISLVPSLYNTCTGGCESCPAPVGDTSRENKVQQGTAGSGGLRSPSLPLDICWSHRERGAWVTPCPRHCQGLMDTAQQSQNRAGTGGSPGSSQQHPAYLSTAPSPASLAGQGYVPAEPPCAQGQRGGSHSHERQKDSWGG